LPWDFFIPNFNRVFFVLGRGVRDRPQTEAVGAVVSLSWSLSHGLNKALMAVLQWMKSTIVLIPRLHPNSTILTQKMCHVQKPCCFERGSQVAP
jgi:hypothetical protein